MLRPSIHAPIPAMLRAAKSSSMPVSPPSLPCMRLNVRVLTSQSCKLFAADAERILQRLTWACAVSVEGDREAADE